MTFIPTNSELGLFRDEPHLVVHHLMNMLEVTNEELGNRLGISKQAVYKILRCCEMERFDVQDWDRHERALYVRGKGGDGRVTRVLPVEGECEWVLNVWFDGRRTGPFLPSQHGDGLIANSISGIVTRLARRAGVRASHHKLRHTCAHHMLAMGSQQNAVQRFLGHRHSATTDIYTAARDADLRAVTSRSYIVGNVVDLGEAA